jgi:hypothetical protein
MPPTESHAVRPRNAQLSLQGSDPRSAAILQIRILPEHPKTTHSRHPQPISRATSYLGLLVNALGWALAFRSGLGVLLAALMVPPLLARIRAEEALLRAHFGDRYDAYLSRTSRLLPGLY